MIWAVVRILSKGLVKFKMQIFRPGRGVDTIRVTRNAPASFLAPQTLKLF